MAAKMKNKFVAKSISKLYLKPDFADVHFVFTTDDEIIKVPAHKNILAVASKVFEAMFFGQLKENAVVEIVDADPDTFVEFLQFFYLPEITLTMENIEGVAHLADKYDMDKCLSMCASFLGSRITKENVLWGYQLAITLKNQLLKKICESKIEMLESESFKSNLFLQCDRSVVEHILKLDTLLCNEYDLFNACVEWAKTFCKKNDLDENNPKNVKNELGECFNLFRFESMTHEEIAKILSDKLLMGLFNPEELRDVFRMKSGESFESDIFKHKLRSRPTPTPALTPSLKLKMDEILTCSLAQNGYTNIHQMKYRESTWFSTNTSVLLSRVVLVSLSVTWSVNCTMNIVEYNGLTFDEKVGTKVLCTTNFELGPKTTYATVSSQVFIHPNRMYEIHLINSKSLLLPVDCNVPVLRPEVKLDEKITIKFYENPSDKIDGNRGLVSSLQFRRI